MSGLNDDVDDGLDSIIEEPDTNPDASDAPTILLVNKTGTPVPSDNDINAVATSRFFGAPVIPNELPNLNAAFLITSQISTAASDISSIRSSVASNCSVCREDAEVIDSLIPGFISDDRPLGYFTDKKTKTQFTETLASMDAEIESQTAMLISTSLDTIETLVQKYRDIKSTAETNLRGSLVKYQLTLAKILVMVDDEDTSNELKTFLDGLSTVLPRDCFELNTKDADVNDSIKGLVKHLVKADFRANLANVICRDLNLTAGANLFMTNGQIYELTETEPFLVIPQETNEPTRSTGFNRSVSGNDYLYGAIDMFSLNYMRNLLNVTTSLTEAMVKSATLIEDAAKNTDVSPKERLDLVTSLVCLSNDYARNAHNIFSFTNSYFDGFDWMMGTIMDMRSGTKAIKE